jgi:hypothetical protein
MTFNSLQEYKRWAEGASQQERKAYWNSLPDLDFERLSADLDEEDERLREEATKNQNAALIWPAPAGGPGR